MFDRYRKRAKMAKKTKIKTPVGPLYWVFITGDGRDQSEDNDGSKMQKTASVVFHKDSPECKKLQNEIQAEWEKYKAANPTKIKKATEPKSLGYKPVKDPETDEDTDYVIFQFKTNSFFPDGKRNMVPVYDIHGQKVDLGQSLIGNESTGIIHGEMMGYEYLKSYGISLLLKGVQLATYKEPEVQIDTEDISSAISEGEAFTASSLMGDIQDQPSDQDTPDL